MEPKSLTERIVDYKKTGKGKENLTQSIGIIVYQLLKNKYHFNDDDRSKFFCIYYKKVPGLLDRFNYCGKPFEYYLNSSLRWNIKTFRTAESRKLGKFKAAHKEPFYLVPKESNFTSFENNIPDLSEWAKRILYVENKSKSISDPVKIRLLFLYLIECEYLDQRIKDGFLEITGFNRKWIFECSAKLKKKIDNRLIRVRKIKNIRNSYFFELYILQEKLKFEPLQSEQLTLERKIRKLKKAIKRLNKIISRAMVHPTHRELAEVLNIPKGTIDSGIYYIKNSFTRREQEKKRSA